MARPRYEIEDFQAITDAIRGEVGDAAIINYSTGTIGVPVQKRIDYLRACRPEVAALNMGSMNYAKYSRSRKQFVFNMVFENPFSEIIELLEAMNELGIKPEHECFDIGHVGEPRAADRHGRPEDAAARGLRDGGRRRHTSDARATWPPWSTTSPRARTGG